MRSNQIVSLTGERHTEDYYQLDMPQLFHDGGPYHIEISPLICKQKSCKTKF